MTDPNRADPGALLTALQEIAPDILSAARSREVGERNATGEPGPTAELAEAMAAEAMADQGERTDELRRIVAAWRHEQPAPSATFTPAVLRALESALSADVGDQAEATDTLNALADALDPPKLRPLRAYADAPVPAPVLWRDPAAAEPETAHPDAVLSIGEVALLSAAGGIGKSMTVLALAVAAAHAHVKAQAAGAACGLRVMAGPVALVSFEDSPARLADRLRFMVPDPGAHVAIGLHLQVAPDPAALWTECGPGPDWAPLWRTIRRTGARLLAIDPASAALADVSTTETGRCGASCGR